MDEDAKRDWINIPHYFRNPLYRVNYLYARLLALKYYELYERDPKAFAAGYLALQRNGYDAAPDVLLKRFLGIELRGDRFVSDILDILKGKMREMEALYLNH
jgi:oligoendopeptidase F